MLFRSAGLNDDSRNAFNNLTNKYGRLIVTLEMMAVGINYMMKVRTDEDYTAIDWTKFFEECDKIGIHLTGLPLYDVLLKLEDIFNDITNQFDELFDVDIFT